MPKVKWEGSAKDKAMDKKMGWKEGSKRDEASDKAARKKYGMGGGKLKKSR